MKKNNHGCQKFKKKIDVSTLLAVFKQFKRNPYKVFIRRGFIGRSFFGNVETHLKILVKLGIIEIVPAIYKKKGKLFEDSTIKGYKWKKRDLK